VKYRWQRDRRRDTAHLDVTPFLSLMVILVPFLLITAVFSPITILELHGLSQEGEASSAAKPSPLEIIVREGSIEVNQGERGRIARIEQDATDDRLKALAGVLEAVKARSPELAEVNIFFEPQTPYDLVVQVMDTARVRVENEGGVVRTVELFPEIGVGEAS
jgi:biopolymer transport protein ExbD